MGTDPVSPVSPRKKRPAKPRQGKPGPKRHITPEVIDALVEARQLCQPKTKMAGIAGITDRTLRNWLAIGQNENARLDPANYGPGEPIPNPDPEAADCFRLFRALEAAEHEGIRRRLARLDRAAEGGTVIKRTVTPLLDKDGVAQLDGNGQVIATVVEEYAKPHPQSDQWVLERTHFRDFARRTINELVGADGGPIQTAGEVTHVDQQSLMERGRARILSLAPGERLPRDREADAS